MDRSFPTLPMCTTVPILSEDIHFYHLYSLFSVYIYFGSYSHNHYQEWN